MKSEILLFNGKRIENEDLNFNDLRRGFLYGDGIFETLISINKKIFRFDQHWERMKKGAFICNLRMPDKKRIKKILSDNLEDGFYYIRLNLWRKRPDIFSPLKKKDSNFLIIIKKFRPYPERFYKEGIKCTISKEIRRNEKSVLSKIKSINFLENVILKIEAEKEKCDDIVVLDNVGYISEGSIANIFFVKNDIIYTPSLECGCLEGITRKIVFEICKKEKIKIKEGFFKPDFLKNCDEVFFTNTLMGIMPVREIKGYFKSKKFKYSEYFGKLYWKILKCAFVLSYFFLFLLPVFIFSTNFIFCWKKFVYNFKIS
ncbi:MAG TPA: aminotransferase class IV [bacterium]|nr:aminotransferase class IV [bacterium]HOM26248.1 aminotransferase class IV [bacterium]